jgi:hypothetical protein
MANYLLAYLAEHGRYPDYEFASWSTEQFRAQEEHCIPW